MNELERERVNEFERVNPEKKVESFYRMND
jgi:hypothetical protein